MQVNGIKIDIEIQTNEINGHASEDGITKLKRKHYMSPHNWESRVDRYSTKDPLVEDFCKVLELNLPRGDYWDRFAPHAYIVTFYISGFPFLFEKNNNRFKLMGVNITKKEGLVALAKTAMYAGTSKKAGGEVFLFFNKYMETPNLIKRAMEERIEYKFPQTEYKEQNVYNYITHKYEFKTLPKTIYHKVLINVQKISKKKYALEISDNVWGEMSEKDLLSFIKIFVNKRRNTRSKWWKILPNHLWEETMGDAPTESQLNTMIQFLLHNRKDKIVIDKSLELVRTLETFNDIRVRRKGTSLVVLVRGKEAFWCICGEIPSKNIGGLQDVITVMFTEKTKDETESLYLNYGGREVCIDNLMGGSSIGDQIYTRAILCMNDAASKEKISTMKQRIEGTRKPIAIDNFDDVKNIWEEE
tara:strand:- start:10026 stop:11270 length:1245 start_codon:yes stop_codon:yes gene_type:complete